MAEKDSNTVVGRVYVTSPKTKQLVLILSKREMTESLVKKLIELKGNLLKLKLEEVVDK